MRALLFGPAGWSKILVAAVGAAAVVVAAGAAALALLSVGDGHKLQTAAVLSGSDVSTGGDIGGNGGGSDVGIKLQTAATSTLPYFQDVSDRSVHAANIERAGRLGIASGTSVASTRPDGYTARTFSPSEMLSKAQIATFLTRTWEATGRSCPSTGIAFFDDVPAGSAHTAGIDCMSALGVVQGVSARTLSPSETVTRGYMVTLMTRMWTAAGRTCPAGADSADGAGSADDADSSDDPNPSFSDVAEDSPHAEGINCMAALGVARGTTAGTFLPSEPVSRAQMATFLVRFYEALSDDS